AMVPQTGEVVALYSSPSFDPNRFVGGVSAAYYDSLNNDPRHPLYNKVLQGEYAPGSTFKLAISALALEDSIITLDSHMPEPCVGFYYFGNRAWHCWKKEGHGNLDLRGAIAQSCDVYFYQLGQKLGLSRLVAGGVSLGFDKKTGIDLPEEHRPQYPTSVPEYFNQKYPRGWTPGEKELNLAIGQGELLLAGRPAARIFLVEVFRNARRELRTVLLGEVDAGLLVEAQRHTAGDEPAQSELLAELVEVDVARLRDGAAQVEVAVPFLLPAMPCAIAEVVEADAGLGHVRVERDDAVLERQRRDGELEGRSRGVLALEHLVVQRVPGIVVQ